MSHRQRTVLAWLGGGNEEGKSDTADCKDAWEELLEAKVINEDLAKH